MKIDVETHEPEVLEGFGDYLKAFRPTMFLEILTDEVGHKVQELVKDLDYLFSISMKIRVSDRWIRSIKVIISIIYCVTGKLPFN